MKSIKRLLLLPAVLLIFEFLIVTSAFAWHFEGVDIIGNADVDSDVVWAMAEYEDSGSVSFTANPILNQDGSVDVMYDLYGAIGGSGAMEESRATFMIVSDYGNTDQEIVDISFQYNFEASGMFIDSGISDPFMIDHGTFMVAESPDPDYDAIRELMWPDEYVSDSMTEYFSLMSNTEYTTRALIDIMANDVYWDDMFLPDHFETEQDYIDYFGISSIEDYVGGGVEIDFSRSVDVSVAIESIETPVPVPGGAVLFISGIIGLAGFRRETL